MEGVPAKEPMISGKYERLSLLFSALLHVLVLCAFVLAATGGGTEKGILMVDVVYQDGTEGTKGDGPDLKTPQAPAVGNAAKHPLKKSEAGDAPASREIPKPAMPEKASFQEADGSEDVSSVVESGEPDDIPASDGEEASDKEPPAGASTALSTPETGDTTTEFGPGGHGGPDAFGQKEERAAVLAGIKASIQKALSYPLLARKRGLEGTVVAAFAIGRDGNPLRIRLLRSSGYSMLDGEVMRTIARASPYPHLDGEVEVPVTFRLKDN